jgi:hypothetical protein
VVDAASEVAIVAILFFGFTHRAAALAAAKCAEI